MAARLQRTTSVDLTLFSVHGTIQFMLTDSTGAKVHLNAGTWRVAQMEAAPQTMFPTSYLNIEPTE